MNYLQRSLNVVTVITLCFAASCYIFFSLLGNTSGFCFHLKIFVHVVNCHLHVKEDKRTTFYNINILRPFIFKHAMIYSYDLTIYLLPHFSFTKFLFTCIPNNIFMYDKQIYSTMLFF